MRRHLVVLVIVALLLLIANYLAAQTLSRDETQNQNSPIDSAPTTLRVTTREVFVDLVALDHRNHLVLDLKPDELQVSEGAETDPRKAPGESSQDLIAPASVDPITSLSIFDPNNPASKQDIGTGFRILASCLERTTVHYLLAFRPGSSSWTAGYHNIAITTTRAYTRLFYRHQYYVGLEVPSPNSPTLKRKEIGEILQQSACYYPVAPLSIRLQARLIDTGRNDVFRYLVSADTRSISFPTTISNATGRELAGIDRRVELDYGTCNFDQRGKPTSYYHAPLDQVLNSADYTRALDRGFPHILEFPASANIALTRVVVRDRATGNMGAADVMLPQVENVSHGKPPIGSFGSIVPAPHSFCGDVYELSEAPDKLPNFGELDPIGSIYTSNLAVPNQFFSNTTGIPGVTPRTNLFGIDYHASFWVRTAGEYRFRMASDDGALLQIDDKQIINLDGLHQVNEASARLYLTQGLHIIHVPYYQGAPVSVALELRVQPPGTNHLIIFDLKDYVTPNSELDQSVSEPLVANP